MKASDHHAVAVADFHIIQVQARRLRAQTALNGVRSIAQSILTRFHG